MNDALPDYSLQTRAKSNKNDIETMSQAELLALHTQIEARLTGVRLSDINLERETLVQFQKAKALQDAANKPDSEIPMNQRAQVQNSLSTVLGVLARIQMELHDSESLKRLKAAVIRVVKKQPKEFQDEFFEMLDGEFATAQQELIS